jgi:hypothetical protein
VQQSFQLSEDYLTLVKGYQIRESQGLLPSVALHRHHITPKHAGGSDDKNNLVTVTRSEHEQLHRILYKENKRWQDLAAVSLISGDRSLDDEQYRELQSSRGRWAHKKCKALGTGTYSEKFKEAQRSPERRAKRSRIAKELKIGFLDPSVQKKIHENHKRLKRASCSDSFKAHMRLNQFGFCDPQLQSKLTQSRAESGHYEKLHSAEVRQRINETIKVDGAPKWSSDEFKALMKKDKWFHFYVGSKRKLGEYQKTWYCPGCIAATDIWANLTAQFGIERNTNLPAVIRANQLHTKGITVSFVELSPEQLRGYENQKINFPQLFPECKHNSSSTSTPSLG